MSRSTRQDTVPAVILMAAATLFTVGRSIVVAQNGMRLTPPQANVSTTGHARVVAASNGPDMEALDRDLRGGGVHASHAVPEPSPLSPPVIKQPQIRPADTKPAEPKPKPAALRLAGVSSDFAILRDANGDHSLRIGGRFGKYTLRQINGSSVILEGDNGESVTLSLSRADH